MLKPLYVALAVALSQTAAAPATGRGAPAVPISAEEQRVYEAVLKSWIGQQGGRQYVNERLGPRPSTTDRGNAECVAGARFENVAAGPASGNSLAGIKFAQPGVQLTDGDRWKPRDPMDHLSEANVDAAVKEAFAHSLITLSQVAFSKDGRDALVEFGMVCGRLCGNGSTLRLHKSGEVWRVARRCGGWIS